MKANRCEPKGRRPLGSHLFFRGRLPVRPVLTLLCTCANGSTNSVFPLQLPMLLHVAAGTAVLK